MDGAMDDSVLTPEQTVRLEGLVQAQHFFTYTHQTVDVDTVVETADVFAEYIRVGRV